MDERLLLELSIRSAAYVRELRDDIGAYERPDRGPQGTKKLMLRALAAADIEMLLTVSLVPVSNRQTQGVCEEWTLHDLLGHLADWDFYFSAWLLQLTSGEEPSLYFTEDGDQFNDWLMKNRAGANWDKNWRDFRDNRAQLIASLGQVSEADFILERNNEKSSFPTVYHCAWSALEHYIHHAADIRRELGVDAPEELLDFHGPYTC